MKKSMGSEYMGRDDEAGRQAGGRAGYASRAMLWIIVEPHRKKKKSQGDAAVKKQQRAGSGFFFFLASFGTSEIREWPDAWIDALRAKQRSTRKERMNCLAYTRISS